MSCKMYVVLISIILMHVRQVTSNIELDYLFASMIKEPAFKLTPPYANGTYNYSFIVPSPSKLFGPNIAFYLFAGQPKSKTAEIIINQDGRFFQTLSEKQYWQSNKVPIPLNVNQTIIDLHIQDGNVIGPAYTIYVKRATE